MNWWRHATVENQPFLCPDLALAAKTAADYKHEPSGDLPQTSSSCSGGSRAAVWNLLVLDQTRADIDLSVVKVIVPGLRSIWSRWGPGRLFATSPSHSVGRPSRRATRT